MQAWDQVKVTAEGKYQGRAGLVIRFAIDVNTVKLDETREAQGEVQNFADSELTLLGR